jgi:hypothetical protein
LRIWDIPPKILCNKHLLGEHRELHAIWAILTANKKGYSKHPETRRWIGKLKALFLRHKQLAEEMKKRGYKHKSPLEKKLATGSGKQKKLLDPIERQIEILKSKQCKCPLR